MNKRTVLRWAAAFSIAAATVVGTMPRLWAEEPATRPATPATETTPPAEKKTAAKISPEAKAELDALTAAYTKLTSLDLAGTINVNIDVQGEKQTENASFTSAFQAPNKFRHAMKNDLIIGSTGEKAYLYSTSDKAYLQSDAPKTRAEFATGTAHAAVSSALNQQNRSLLMALSDPPTGPLLDEVTEVKKVQDVKIGEKSYSALAITGANEDVKLVIDPDTHLIRQLQLDLSRAIKSQGAQDVKAAMVTFDYTSSVPNAAVKDGQFAWTPPAGAKDMSQAARGEMMKDDAASAMVGKPAPDFTLAGMDDKNVSLAQHKGSVVVLDFWATWCGPCVAGLPHLDKLYQEKKDAGLKVFAVDQGEEKDVVAAFIEKKKLGIPVLLDTEGKVGNLYGVSGIPHQVVIGKDGTVKKVTVGFSPREVDHLRKIVETEMAK